MSVEEIVQLLKKTGRSDPLPQRVLSSLHHLDSRTVALLLKDISKAGLDSRSIELFDWLRALPERHLLRHLCDVFTYTAMISLCIYQQNVDRAMELLEEMRQRGVERNVHTYTALMNVCIKCGKLPAALDIFAAMKGEGCTPNVVTYNTLIDVYGKLGQWDRAVSVLNMMRGEVGVQQRQQQWHGCKCPAGVLWGTSTVVLCAMGAAWCCASRAAAAPSVHGASCINMF
jgi:pentatricopeptide repeat domain-containing protein 1